MALVERISEALGGYSEIERIIDVHLQKKIQESIDIYGFPFDISDYVEPAPEIRGVITLTSEEYSRKCQIDNWGGDEEYPGLSREAQMERDMWIDIHGGMLSRKNARKRFELRVKGKKRTPQEQIAVRVLNAMRFGATREEALESVRSR